MKHWTEHLLEYALVLAILTVIAIYVYDYLQK